MVYCVIIPNSNFTLPFPSKVTGGREILAQLSVAEKSVSFTEKTTASLVSAGTFLIFIATRLQEKKITRLNLSNDPLAIKLSLLSIEIKLDKGFALPSCIALVWARDMSLYHKRRRGTRDETNDARIA